MTPSFAKRLYRGLKPELLHRLRDELRAGKEAAQVAIDENMAPELVEMIAARSRRADKVRARDELRRQTQQSTGGDTYAATDPSRGVSSS